jgi:hypothetical protein
VRGLWRGTGPTVVRLSLGAGINFVVLEKLKHLMLEHLPRTAGQLDWLQAALVGGEGVGTQGLLAAHPSSCLCTAWWCSHHHRGWDAWPS